jgi:hypothetical protein
MSECVSQITCPVSVSLPHHCICLFCKRDSSFYANCVDTGLVVYDAVSLGVNWRLEGTQSLLPHLRVPIKAVLSYKSHQTQCNIQEDLISCLILLIAYVDGGVLDRKPCNTRRFWVRSTESINLCLIITCILLLQGYSESSLPWTRHGYTAQIAFLSSRGRSVGRSVPCAVSQSHRHVCIWQ